MKNNQNYQNPKYDKEIKKYERVNQPLNKEFHDKGNLFLPDGYAHQVAKEFNNAKIKSHQLRKILNTSKSCLLEPDEEKARNLLFSIVPLAAYNAGRIKDTTILYNFLQATINQKSILSKKDIETFDELFTSIVAYHKYESESKKGGKK